MIQIKAILYDFDGPIMDTFEHGLAHLKEICKVHCIRFEPAHEKRLLEFWGIVGDEMLQKVFHISSQRAHSLYEVWGKVVKDKASPVPGVHEALLRTRRDGMTNVIFTSRRKASVHSELQRVGLSHFFDACYTRDDLEFQKPDPRAFIKPLAHLKREFNISREECLFVGDTWVDARCGFDANVRTLVVLNGPYKHATHASRHEVSKENLIPSIAELPEWLSRQNPVML